MLPKIWPEMELEISSVVFPTPAEMRAGDDEVRRKITNGLFTFTEQDLFSFANKIGNYRGRKVTDFSFESMVCMLMNPVVDGFIGRVTEGMSRHGSNPDSAPMRSLLAQCLNAMYHVTHWRDAGKKVYYLDDATYQLLAHTELPNIPAHLLTFPVRSFYLMLPPSAFAFSVVGAPDGEPAQRCAGVHVTTDRIVCQPDESRELAVYVTGEHADHFEVNSAYFGLGIGPDARLKDIQFVGKNYGRDGLPGDEHLCTTVPRVVIGLLLYLASEHPDVVAVPPVKRNKFVDIRSPKQREAALRNQEDRLKKVSRLGYLHVGKQIGAAIRKSENVGEGGWKLDRQVWVRGHHKMQVYGPNHAFRRPIWVMPYKKGNDLAEAMVRLAKVQTAKEVSK